MKKRWTESDWYIPPDTLFHFGSMFVMPIIVMVALTVATAILRAKQGDPLLAYIAGSLGVIGVVLLFFARLPLYRQKKFFAFGPRQLTGTHRKLYWWAYAFIVPSVIMLLGLLALLKS